jgi:uncharacterized protein
MNTARTIAINQILIEETGLQLTQIKQTVVLLEGGATVPFIARYRKEATGELDEVEIRLVQERLEYHTALNERRQIILKSINEQGKLTPELRQKIEKTRQKTELEDLYLPFKPKRRTKALIAKERGLEPLAVQLLAARGQGASDEELARPFLNAEQEITTTEEALTGAGHILAEQFADVAEARAIVRDLTWQKGLFSSQPSASLRCITISANRCSRFHHTGCSPCGEGKKKNFYVCASRLRKKRFLADSAYILFLPKAVLPNYYARSSSMPTSACSPLRSKWN